MLLYRGSDEMTYLGLDLGTKTLGISKSSGIIASPYKTLRHDEDYDYLLNELEKIIQEEHIDKIVLGLPKNMNNTMSEMALVVLNFKSEIEKRLGIEVILEDERLTSKISNDVLTDYDISRQKRKKRVDGVASVVILQSYLNRKERENEK